MDCIRIRLKFRNVFPFYGESCWYLLDCGKIKTISEFLADVEKKFALDPLGNLRGILKGCILPSWERIFVIRDEDEVLIVDTGKGIECMISSREEQEFRSSITKDSLYVSKDDRTDSKCRKKDEQYFMKSKHRKKPNEQNSLSQCNEAPKKAKKRRKIKESIDDEVEGSSKLQKMLAVEEQACSKKSKNVNTSLHEKSFSSKKKTEKNVFEKCKEKNSEILNNLKENESENASSRKKKKKRVKRAPEKQNIVGKKTEPMDSEKTEKVADKTTGMKNDSKETEKYGSKEKEKYVDNRSMKMEESPFQVLSKNAQNVQNGSVHIKLKSKSSGNHFFFDSDDDDCGEGNFSQQVDNKKVDHQESQMEFDDNNDFAGGVFMPDKASTSTPCDKSESGFHTQAKVDTSEVIDSNEVNGLKNKNNQLKNYDILTSLQGVPRVGDNIAFKVLEISLSYTPEISDYKEGIVQGVDSNGSVKVLLADQSRSRKIGDGTLSRKFELNSDDEVENDDTLEVHWKELIDPKLI